jgi:anti-sigma factor RsiW
MQEDPVLKDSVLTDEDRIQEELVAFLDGELDSESQDQVEHRLRTDRAYRQKLKELQAAWDLLDELPRVEATESFTQTTVKMVALTGEAEALTVERQLLRRRWGSVATLAGAVLAALGLGYAVMLQRLDEPNQRLVQDLPVIENMDLYRIADSVDFLRSLDDASLFDEEQNDVP